MFTRNPVITSRTREIMNVAFIVQTVFLINNVKSKIPSNENNTYRLATKFFSFLGNYRPCSVVSFIYLF